MVKKVIIIFIVAAILRFWAISSLPSSLSMDEIAVGYDSYSILKTGRDQHGEFLPLSFKSVGDYKAPVAFYLTVPSLLLFGENELGVRFPAAFLGTLTAVAFFFLLSEVSIGKKGAFFGALWLAINPWHVYLSRTSFDGIIALFFLIFGIYLFLKAIRSNAHLLVPSALFLSLSVWSYHVERLFVPLLTVFLLLYFRPKKLLIPGLVVLFFAIPFVYQAFWSQGIFDRIGDLWVGRDPGTSWINQYLNYFDFNLWFAKGLNLTPPNYPDSGFLYYIDFPLFLIGAYALFKGLPAGAGKNKFLKFLTLFWFLAGPLPASLTRGGINPGRILVWLPFFGFVIASSYDFLFEKLKNKFVIGVYLIFLIWNVGYFWDMYKYNFPKYYADLWHYGYKEAAQYACANRARYEKIIITDKYGIEWPSVKTIPYLYILFYCKWDPATYLTDKNLYNIEFRQPQWRIDSKEKNWLLIGSRWDFPASAYEPKPAFYFVETTTR